MGKKNYINNNDQIIRRSGSEICLNVDNKLLSPDFISSGFEEERKSKKKINE